MKYLIRYSIFSLVLCLRSVTYSQTSEKFVLPEPVTFALDLLNEAYLILDEHSEEVWNGWNDYLSYPVLLRFENDLQVLVGYTDPPGEFVSYPDLKVHGLKVFIDTTKMTTVQIRPPLLAGGGFSILQSRYNKPVQIVLIPFYSDYDQKFAMHANGETYVITYMHELFHCFQDELIQPKYANLFIVPDVEYSIYSEIEGKALAFAYKQGSKEEAFKYLKDFCIARSNKIKNMKPADIQSASLWEFREGTAKYSEYVLLNGILKGFSGAIKDYNRSLYNGFANADTLIQRYYSELIASSDNVLEQYGKNYDYGCFQSILLDRYFSDWRKDIESGLWLHQILHKRLGISPNDSLMAVQRFRNIYNIDRIRGKNAAEISARDETRKILDNRKGRTYIIDTEAIMQPIDILVDKSSLFYQIGTKKMYPLGTGNIMIGGVEIYIEPLPSELYRTTNLRIIDSDPDMYTNPYEISYQSVDSIGVYSDVIVRTPVLTLKAPKISIMEFDDTTVFFIKSKL